MLPSDFIRSLSDHTSETDPLIQALEQPAPVSIRFNPYKIAGRPEGDPVPWSRYGFYLAERPVFTTDPLFHAGTYYVQEAGSMFLEQLFQQAVGEREGLAILDLCAAPGGKTTHLASLAGLESLVVANEVIRSRANILRENVTKWGLGNVAVTSHDAADFRRLKNFFDVVVMDVPCSGEGMFRKTPDARQQWSPDNVRLCAGRQQRIFSDVWDSIKPGGIVIYSTCTFNRTENEDNLSWIAANFCVEPVEIDTDPQWGIVTTVTDGIHGYRFYPHRLRSEGFFVAVLRKAGDPVKAEKKQQRKQQPLKRGLQPATRKETEAVAHLLGQPEFMRIYKDEHTLRAVYSAAARLIERVSDQLHVLSYGVEIGQMYHGKLKTSHSLAMFHDLNRESLPVTELEPEHALRYLRKEELPALLFAEGPNLVTFQGVSLGFARRIGHRCNNLYPKESRILHY